MGHTKMTLAEFEDLVFAHGPDLSEWPDHVQVRAAKLLETSPEAQALMDSAADLQSILTRARPEDPVPSVELISSILSDAATVRPAADLAPAIPPTKTPLFSRIWTVFSPAAACAASAALGLWLGYAGPVDLTDVAGGTFELAGLAVSAEFALLDDVAVSPIAGVIDLLEASE